MKRHKKVADVIVQAILRGEKEVAVADGGPSYQIRRVNNNTAGVEFSTLSVAWSNPKVRIADSIAPLIKHANNQLSWQPSFEVKTRIVLLVNLFWMSRLTEDVLAALASIYQELLLYEHIDQIWLLNGGDNGSKRAEFLFGREEALAHEEGWSSIPTRGREWLAKWFYNLGENDKNQRLKLIVGVEACIRDMAPHAAFPNPLERSQIVRACEWLRREISSEQKN